jgi:hypothetical protein
MQMRYLFLVTLMLATMLGLITWATRPDLFSAQYDKVTAPIEKHFAEQRAAIWKSAKDRAWHQWMAQAHLPSDCMHPTTALHELECKNKVQLQESAFENDWANKVASGWRPEGIN